MDDEAATEMIFPTRATLLALLSEQGGPPLGKEPVDDSYRDGDGRWIERPRYLSHPNTRSCHLTEQEQIAKSIFDAAKVALNAASIASSAALSVREDMGMAMGRAFKTMEQARATPADFGEACAAYNAAVAVYNAAITAHFAAIDTYAARLACVKDAS